MQILSSILFLSQFFLFAFSERFRCNQLLNSDALFSFDSLSSFSDFVYRSQNYTFYFNFCILAKRQCRNQSAYVVAFPLDSSGNEIPEECIRLTSDSVFTDYSYSLLDDGDASQGVKLSYSNGDPILIAGKNVTTSAIFELSCVYQKFNKNLYVTKIDIEKAEFKIRAKSKAGCPHLEINANYNWILESEYFLATLMIVLGIFECLFGLYLLGPSLFIIGFLIGFGLLRIYFEDSVIKPDSGSGLIWFALIVCIIFGGGLGYLATSFPKIGFFIKLGIWWGVITAFLINRLFLDLSDSDDLFYLLVVAFGAIGAFLGKFKWRIVCVLSTSIIGSYSTFRGFSIFIGGYPDEFTVAKKIQYKEMDSVGWAFYVYFAFMVVFALVGMILQFKNMRKGGNFNGEFWMAKYLPQDETLYMEMSLLAR